MNLDKIGKWATIFFMSSGIFVSVLLVETIILAFFSQFRAQFIYLSLITAFILAIFFSIQIKKDVKLLPKITSPVLVLIFLISLLLIFYPHDTFGGRDESVYSNNAVRIAQTASLNIPSYLNNLPDNFVEGTRTMPSGYVVWLAISKIFFSNQGILRNNVILIILGLFSFFLVSSHITGKTNGLISVLLFSSSMPFLWFSRETMSENLSFFLLWSLILFLFLFLKTKRNIYLIGLFLNAWLFGLTRYEGFLLQFVILFILPVLIFLKKISLKKNLVILIIYILMLVSNIYITGEIVISPLLKAILPKVANSIKRDVYSLIPNNFSINYIKNPVMNTGDQPKFQNLSFFVFLMMAKYNFILVIFSIFIVTVNFLFRINKIEKTKKLFFIILILLIPEYYKFISPNVTIDQPWLYRRYVYALFPLGYLCLTILLNQLKTRKLLIILLSSFFMINIILSSPTLFLKNNWTLVDKLEEITENISKKDFVIIRNKTLGHYYPGSFLILNKGVRSAFASTIDRSKFLPDRKIFNGISYNKIFLLSTNDKDGYPSFNIVSRKSVDVEYTQLVPSCQLYLLGIEEKLKDPYNVGLLSFLNVEKYCSQPRNEIVKHKEKLYLYELTYL